MTQRAWIVCLVGLPLVALPSGGVLAQDIFIDGEYALENGDTNGDTERDLSDGIYLLHHLFLGGRAPVPLALCGGDEPAVSNGDVNADGALDVSDGVGLLTWLYSGGSPPAEACGDGEIAHRGRHRVRVIPNRGILGRAYSHLAATWWQWALSIPATGHPLIDGDCDVAQPRRVFYLGGSFATSEVHRTCTVPKGSFVYFPIINTECSNLEPDPFFCTDEPSCLSCNDAFFDEGMDVLSLTINGEEIRRLTRFRTQSGVFDIGPFPADNIFGLDEGATGISLADGYYILLAPLPRGEHTIEFRGCYSAFGGCEGFELIVSYDLTVD